VLGNKPTFSEIKMIHIVEAFKIFLKNSLKKDKKIEK